MSTKDRMCIVAVGYNRPDAMHRLLTSLSNAKYYEEKVDLLISIDKGEKQQTIIELAERFQWNNGEKKIRAFSERQGLRSHILQCGDVSEYYKGVIVLEDDITVSTSFYNYVRQSILTYSTTEKIAGISLYKHQINVGVSQFFEPEYNGYDVFMMQYAQSWGQCWTYSMWSEFRAWYQENEDYFERKENFNKVPSNLMNWGKQSWLKYYIAYVIERDLYFVYPYFSVSTNHAESGQHVNEGSSDFQVALFNEDKEYCFPNIENAVKYDAFFERVGYQVTGYENKKIIFDLYGGRVDVSGGEYLISSASHPYKVIENWRLKYHPHEVNCRYPEIGNGLYVYDLSESDKPPKDSFSLLRVRYDVRTYSWKSLFKYGIFELGRAIRKKLGKR